MQQYTYTATAAVYETWGDRQPRERYQDRSPQHDERGRVFEQILDQVTADQ